MMVTLSKDSNGNGLSRNILMAVLAAIFAAVTASYVAQGAKIDSVASDVTEAKGAIKRIETRLNTMDTADEVSAAEERDRLKAEVLELQQQQRETGR